MHSNLKSNECFIVFFEKMIHQVIPIVRKKDDFHNDQPYFWD